MKYNLWKKKFKKVIITIIQIKRKLMFNMKN